MQVYLFISGKKILGSYVGETLEEAREQLAKSLDGLSKDTAAQIETIKAGLDGKKFPMLLERKQGLENYLKEREHLKKDKEVDQKVLADSIKKSKESYAKFEKEFLEEAEKELKKLEDVYKIYTSSVDKFPHASLSIEG